MKTMGRPIGGAFRRKPGGGSNFDRELSQADLASFPTSKVEVHGSGTRQVGYDANMDLNYIHNVGSVNSLLKMLADPLTDASRCLIQFYMANAVSSGGAGHLRPNIHTPMMVRTDGYFRGYGRNDIRYYNYVDQADSPSQMFAGLAIDTVYEMEVWKVGSSVKMRMRNVGGEWGSEFAVTTASGTGVTVNYVLHAGKGGGVVGNFRWTSVGINYNV